MESSVQSGQMDTHVLKFGSRKKLLRQEKKFCVATYKEYEMYWNGSLNVKHF